MNHEYTEIISFDANFFSLKREKGNGSGERIFTMESVSTMFSVYIRNRFWTESGYKSLRVEKEMRECEKGSREIIAKFLSVEISFILEQIIWIHRYTNLCEAYIFSSKNTHSIL